MPGFSRGPWKVVGKDFTHRYICSPEGKSPVCLVLTSSERTPEQDEANLAVILGIPEIHGALADLVSAIDGEDDQFMEEALAAARVLIEKHPSSASSPRQLRYMRRGEPL